MSGVTIQPGAAVHSSGSSSHNIAPPKYQIRCGLKGHNNEEILFICMTPQCTKPTRFLCAQCAVDEHSDHIRQCIQLKQLEAASESAPYIKNWPHVPEMIRIVRFVQNNQSSDFSISKYVSELFEEFRRQILEEITKVEKEVVKKLQARQKQLDDFCEDMRGFLRVTYNLDKLKQIVKDYGTQKVEFRKIMADLAEFADDTERLVKEREILQIFEEFHQENELEELEVSEESFRQQTSNILYHTKYLQYKIFKQSLRFDVSKFQQSEDRIQLRGGAAKILPGPGYCMMYSNSFQRRENVTFKFRLSGELNACFLIGVLPGQSTHNSVHFFSGGNQICLHCQKSKGDFITKEGKLPLWRAHKPAGTVYCVDVNVEKNRFVIADEALLSVMDNKYRLEENQEWRLVVVGGKDAEFDIDIISLYKTQA